MISDGEIFKKADGLVDLALQACEKAYCPYSKAQVGAALLCDDGEIFTGCNIENASYPAGICAERTAIFKAVSEGKKDFSAIAIVGKIDGVYDKPFPPCGICRQVMNEFCGADFKIILGYKEGFEIHTLGELLPLGFEL